MAHSLTLDSLRAKMTRAYAHVRELDELMRPFGEENPNRFVREDDGDSTKLVFNVVEVPYIDPAWAVIVGEVLYNLRSAYDHLAHQLVLLDRRHDPTRRTQFPVRETRADKDGNDRITNLNPCVTRSDILAAIDAVQPYNTDPYFHDYLWAINYLCNVDKHRQLLVMAGALHLDRLWYGLDADVPSPSVRVSIKPLEDGDPVAWFDFHGTEAPAAFDPHLALTIKLNEGPYGSLLRGLAIVDFLGGCIEHLAGDINYKGFGHLFDEAAFAPGLPDGRLDPSDIAANWPLPPPSHERSS